MSNNIPAKLKAADITRYASRASQLEKVKPVISYWCNYWIVNQILTKGLHNTDDECLNFTTNLMDELEKFKSENADNDAVTDDTAGQAYVEEFGLDTFQRADNAVRANKASLQTADTFQAAATFLELINIWEKPNAEIASKIKYAKYHALRIVKAVKAGEDPNASNPPTEEQATEEESSGGVPIIETTSASAVEAELGNPPTDGEARKGRQASVEEVPDEFPRVQRELAAQSYLNESIHPSRSSSAAPNRPGLSNVTSAIHSELPSPPAVDSMMDLESSLRQRPSHLSQASVPDLPAAPSDFPQGSPASSTADLPSGLGAPPHQLPSLNTLQSFPPPGPVSPIIDIQPPRAPRPISPESRDDVMENPPVAAITPSVVQPKPVHQASTYARGPSGEVIDEESISQSQKHARWAVSALNFDDVDTAIKELKNALRLLGSQ